MKVIVYCLIGILTPMLTQAVQLKMDKKNLVCKDILGSEIKNAHYGDYNPLNEVITYEPKFKQDRESMLYFSNCDACENPSYRLGISYFLNGQRPSMTIEDVGPSMVENKIEIQMNDRCKITSLSQEISVNSQSSTIRVKIDPNSDDCIKSRAFKSREVSESEAFKNNLKIMLCRKYDRFFEPTDSTSDKNKTGDTLNR